MNMQRWPYRYHLSTRMRLRRSHYEVLRDQMDLSLIKLGLIDSYHNFCQSGQAYPFVQKRELKPRARVSEREHANQNHFLILFCEGTIPNEYKKYIRFFDTNKVTKDSIDKLQPITLHKRFTSNLRYFNNPHFNQLIEDLSEIDYALLIQNDPSIKKQTRYQLSHFHVRIDWPIDNATEDMGIDFRYITKDLYERGEDYAQALQNKLFENYGFHYHVGGRRTAGVVAAQLLKRMNFISTVYVASAEARTLTRLSERGVSKYVLIKIPMADILRLASEQEITIDSFVEKYLIDYNDDFGVGILHVVYRNSIFSKPPEDGKLRKLRPDYQWLTVNDQLLIPTTSELDAHPVRYNIIYSMD